MRRRLPILTPIPGLKRTDGSVTRRVGRTMHTLAF
jgi:hypothetical protein